MRRREFLGQVVASVSLLGMRSARAQTSNKRAAIVIGINKAGNLPVLRAAASGAEQMATWLASQQFDVTPFLDSSKPVRLSDVFDKINEIVDKDIYDQLVVYFAGHGCVISYSERWLLSGAPVNPNEAINVIQSVYLARQSGIGNVVFISDCCRSAPDSIQAGNVIGGTIFPNRPARAGARTFVDEFYAAHPGEAALERSVDQSTKSYEGIYTSAFLGAFQHPTQTMIATIEGVKVVPNRRLDGFLISEVSKRAAAISLELSQLPESLVQSPDQTYIGRLADDSTTTDSATPPPQTINDLAKFSIQQALAEKHFQPPDVFKQVAAFEPFSASVARVLAEPQGPAIRSRTGFTVSGAGVEGVTVSPGFDAPVPPLADPGTPVLIEINSGTRRSGSIALRFTNGTGGVFAILSGFIGNVTVGEAGVSNINYNPSRESGRYGEFLAEKPRLDALRASVAAAAKFGAFDVGTGPEAERWGDRIRVLKSIDPTLGLYAAYAFDRAGQFSKTVSVSNILAGDLGTEFFDTAMLAGKLAGKPFRDRSVAPFVPMLAQGWDLLRLKGIQLDPRLVEARTRLRPALWTTFAPQDVELVSSLVRES